MGLENAITITTQAEVSRPYYRAIKVLCNYYKVCHIVLNQTKRFEEEYITTSTSHSLSYGATCLPSTTRIVSMTVTNTAPANILRWNRQTYKRLKLALSIGLRRQIFIAVCDDLKLRNHLAKRLQAELEHEQVINLNLNLSEPNPLAQINQWLNQHRQSKHQALRSTFQILGVELLTRQPAYVQGLFLRHLQNIERSISGLESSLLLWLPRPWFHTIQQSAPEFWSWHNAVFEFEGEPTPVSAINTEPVVESTESTIQTLTEEKVVRKQNLRHLVGRDFGKSKEVANIRKQHSGSSRTERVPVKQRHREFVFEAVDDKSQTEPTEHSHNGKNALVINHLPSSVNDRDISEADLLNSHNQEIDKQRSHQDTLAARINFDQHEAQSHQAVSQETTSTPLSPSSLAQSYLQLGNRYRDRIQLGETNSENLIAALQAYEQALLLLEAAPIELQTPIPDILNDIGNLYWMLSCLLTDTEQKLFYLENGIKSYQQALSRISLPTAAETYAMIQNNLGAAYSDLARYYDPSEYLQKSVASYQETLRYRSAQQDPLKYASTLNNLGTAYWHLAQQQQPAENLKMAIAVYSEALSHYERQQVETMPEIAMQWAMIQNNLGTVYWNLAQYEQPANCLQLAVEGYHQALKYRTPETLPAGCAATQNNLGTAYWHLALLNESNPAAAQAYIELCIVAYEIAIALAQELANNQPPIGVGFDRFATYNNLGIAQYQLATDAKFTLERGHQSAHLEASLDSHLQALNGYPEQSEEYQLTFKYIIKTIRTLYREFGAQAQNLALSKVPAHLLSEIMLKL